MATNNPQEIKEEDHELNNENPHEIIEKSRILYEWLYQKCRALEDCGTSLFTILPHVIEKQKDKVNDVNRIKGLFEEMLLDELKNDNEFLRNCIQKVFDDLYGSKYYFCSTDAYIKKNNYLDVYDKLMTSCRAIAVNKLKEYKDYFQNNFEEEYHYEGIKFDTDRDFGLSCDDICKFTNAYYYAEKDDSDPSFVMNIKIENKNTFRFAWRQKIEPEYFRTVVIYIFGDEDNDAYCHFNCQRRQDHVKSIVNYCRCREYYSNEIIPFRNTLMCYKILKKDNRIIVEDISHDYALARDYLISKEEVSKILNGEE